MCSNCNLGFILNVEQKGDVFGFFVCLFFPKFGEIQEFKNQVLSVCPSPQSVNGEDIETDH